MKRKKKETQFLKETQRASRLENLSGRLNIPRDILEETLLLTLVGNECIKVENYKAIMDYSEEVIKIYSHNKKIIICGKKLHLEYCSDLELRVTGKIKQIQFEE